jgi:hypothetical protein
MKGDCIYGYYGILFQLYPSKYGDDSLCPGSNNQQARIDVNTLKEIVVKPYLQSLKSNWIDKDGGEIFDKLLNR